MFRLRHVCALLSQTLVPGAILKGGQDTTRARKSPENKCEGFLHGSLSRVGKIALPIHPDNPHLTTTTRHVMVGITRSKLIFFFFRWRSREELEPRYVEPPQRYETLQYAACQLTFILGTVTITISIPVTK